MKKRERRKETKTNVGQHFKGKVTKRQKIRLKEDVKGSDRIT